MLSFRLRAVLALFMVGGLAGPAPALDPPGISLDEARARAFASSPALTSASAAAGAAGGTLRQAGAWPNPELEVEVEEFGGDRPGWDEAEVTWSLTQRVELPGLFGARRARVQTARFDREALEQEVASARRELASEVERRFATALAARERWSVLADDDSLAEASVRAVRALVEAGEVSPIELDRMEAERARVRVLAAGAPAEHRRALRALAELWGAEVPDFSRVEGSLEAIPAADSAGATGGSASPEVRRAEAQVGAAQAALREAERSRWPELALRGGVRQSRATNEQVYLGGAGLELPLWDRRGGTVQESRARLAMARAEAIAARAQVRIARDDAQDAYASALGVARSLQESELPRARAIHAAIEEGYRRGKFGLLDLLDARRQLLRARLDHLDALRDVWLARAELARWSAAESTHPVPDNEGGSR